MAIPSPARAILIALAVPILACEEPSDGGPTGPALGSVDEFVATYDGLAVEVSGVWTGWAIEPVPGPRLDAFALRAVNGAAAPRFFDPRDLRIETADGVQWPRIVVGTETELRPVRLGPFEDAVGWIIFRIPADARAVAVVWIAAPGLALRVPLPTLPSKLDG